jgi:hypothetical protein
MQSEGGGWIQLAQDSDRRRVLQKAGNTLVSWATDILGKFPVCEAGNFVTGREFECTAGRWPPITKQVC